LSSKILFYLNKHLQAFQLELKKPSLQNITYQAFTLIFTKSIVWLNSNDTVNCVTVVF